MSQEIMKIEKAKELLDSIDKITSDSFINQWKELVVEELKLADSQTYESVMHDMQRYIEATKAYSVIDDLINDHTAFSILENISDLLNGALYQLFGDIEFLYRKGI